MHLKSDDVEFVIQDNADEIFEDFIASLLNRYYITWLVINDRQTLLIGQKTKATIIKPINKEDNKYFQYVVTITLNHRKNEKNPEKISKIKRFIHKHNCEGINYLFEKNNRKNFDENNLEIALNLLHSKNEKIYGPYF